jgi:hypothetical protein
MTREVVALTIRSQGEDKFMRWWQKFSNRRPLLENYEIESLWTEYRKGLISYGVSWH